MHVELTQVRVLAITRLVQEAQEIVFQQLRVIGIRPRKGPIHGLHHLTSETEAILGSAERSTPRTGCRFPCLRPQKLQSHRKLRQTDPSLLTVLSSLITHYFRQFVESRFFQAQLFGDALAYFPGCRRFARLNGKSFVQVAAAELESRSRVKHKSRGLT